MPILIQTCRLATALFEALPALNAALPAEMACVGVTFPPGEGCVGRVR